ncbi:ubiquinol-cytochrome c reductase iron-sulfur subunit [Sedimenticola selenatireducens]|uniref:ubiquinol-cytochrome c reductase iron-sulfur subunit n=1 Tax=Sedimenticola selenatireducens TaxID=191960 RepID=UPI0004B6C917|nr:ubiquinol-cytochrome c reductase iron-sulfur subunit [Sedimenticola selenatireducens]
MNPEDLELGDRTLAVDLKRRRLLTNATTVVGAVGVAVLTVPFIGSLKPSQRALVAGAPVVVDFGKLEPGQQITVVWRGKPVWVLRRTQQMLADMESARHLERLRDPASDEQSQQPEYARNPARAINPDYLVTIAICTHLGCVPSFRPELAPADLGSDWIGGYFCPCHGSRYDLAGRVFKSMPAPLNLEIPPYRYLEDSRIEIGSDNA